MAGSRTVNTHFVLHGPQREKLGCEAKKYQRTVSTKYVIHLMDEEEIEQMQRAKVQCVFRGLTNNASVNQFLRQAVADYLREKGLYGRMSMIHDYRHRVVMGYFTEIIMVVYVMRNPSDAEVRRGHDVMGFDGTRMDFRHRGIVLDAYKSLEATDAVFISPVVRREKPHLVFQNVRWSNYETMVSRLLQLVDINNVDYWVVATTTTGERIETALGLVNGVEPRTLPAELLREFVELKPGSVRVGTHLPFQTPPQFLMKPPEGTQRETESQVKQGQATQQEERKGKPEVRNPERQPEFRATQSPPGIPVTPRGVWVGKPSSGTGSSDITTVTITSLGSRFQELEAAMATLRRENNVMTVQTQAQLTADRERGDRLEARCAELQQEISMIRAASQTSETTLSQMRGAVDSALSQMVRSQEETRNQLQLILQEFIRRPDRGSTTNTNV